MKRITRCVLGPALLLLAGHAVAQMPEPPIDNRVQVRAYALWWMARQNRTPLSISLERADNSFDSGDLYKAERQYSKLAGYGDKFAQFRLGLIAIEQDRPEQAWAWFKLANEGHEYREFETFPDAIWAVLSPHQRVAARVEYRELALKYSDLALAHQMEKIFRKQLKMATGSRLGYTGALVTSDSLPAKKLYGMIRTGRDFSRELIDTYGTVTLGELEVLEPAEKQPAGADQP